MISMMDIYDDSLWNSQLPELLALVLVTAPHVVVFSPVSQTSLELHPHLSNSRRLLRRCPLLTSWKIVIPA